MSTPKVTILIPHYKTLELTKLCLRLLRKYTDLNQARVLVIDNGSEDESTQYLKTVAWIELFIRDTKKDKTPWESHGNALNDALVRVDTPYVLSFHTDTIVKHKNWLAFLLQHIEGKANVAGVGSWKLEAKPWYKRFLKTIEYGMQLAICRLCKKKKYNLYGTQDNPYYLRSHCALYRTDLLKKYNLGFIVPGSTAGKELHYRLVELGYDMLFLRSETLGQYIDHLNHATMVLNADEMDISSKAVKKGLKRVKKAFKLVKKDEILAADYLDRS